MDKLIRVPKSKKAEEPLLDIEERRRNYDDRRSYTSYDEITKDFEDDFRCQDDVEDDNDICARPPALGIPDVVREDKRLQPQGLEELLLIGNGDCNRGGRQRKQPILREAAAAASIPHANPVELCAIARRDARYSATERKMNDTSRMGVARVRRIGETGTGTLRDTDDDEDRLGVKSSKTLEESIRESLTINNTAAWNNSEDKPIDRFHQATNHLIFEMNEFYIDMLERLSKMRTSFGSKRQIVRDDLVDPQIKKEFAQWILTDQYDIIKPNGKSSSESCKYNSNVLQQFENIKRLDQEIEMAESKWKNMKRERLEIQSNLCKQMDQHDFQKSKVFLELCASEIASEEITCVDVDTKKSIEKQKCKSAVIGKNNFIKRNVDIAKNMSFPVCLTDEEKIKLDAILTEESDNFENDDVLNNTLESIELKEDEKIDLNQPNFKLKNQYKLLDDDWKRMSQINKRIKGLSHLEENILDINNVESQLEVDAKLGKNWKYSLLDERLKEIDEQLATIIQAREAEVENFVDAVDINQSAISLESIHEVVF